MLYGPLLIAIGVAVNDPLIPFLFLLVHRTAPSCFSADKLFVGGRFWYRVWGGLDAGLLDIKHIGMYSGERGAGIWYGA